MDQTNKTQAQGKTQSHGMLWPALGNLARILVTDPATAEQGARELLDIIPAQPQALQLVVYAFRIRGDTAGARTFLETMAVQRPGLAAVHYELGLLLADIGESEAAVGALSRVVELEPDHPSAWRTLGEELARTGKSEAAAKALARHARSSILDVKTLEQATGLAIDQTETAINLLRDYLNMYSTDVEATRILGELYMRINRNDLAEEIFAHALELARDYTAARVGYVSTLHAQLKWHEENDQLDILLEESPDDPDYRFYKGTVLFRLGRTGEAIRYCENLVKEQPDNARFWLAYAYALRSEGRSGDCVTAFRKSVEILPGLGESWWGLANLKTFRFSPADIATMQTQLARADLDEEERCHIHFALGRAFEQEKNYPESFEQYSQANASRRARNPYNPQGLAESVKQTRTRYTRDFFRAHAHLGSPSKAPIFIPGLPRSGSSLVEQILSTHSEVEGLSELPVLGIIAKRIATKELAAGSEAAPFEGQDLSALGEEYIKWARAYGKSGLPRFTDKMPGNFHYLGLICTILPNAKIIDVHRNPLDCCLSNFKQNFPQGSGPSYDLADMGRAYRSYVEVMAYFDEVLPGRVYRLIYEDLVQDPETEIRRLLEHCDLPFEEKCLRHYESGRNILTASSEQIRRPVNRDGLDQWRPYEQWLGPLKEALGSVLTMYPAIPGDFEEAARDTWRQPGAAPLASKVS
ncbi:MAG TPA: sulfotransferase [Rhizomicrobium sp.]|nr:sulfotransferase [Rhizomicrobium sp.]